MGMSSFLRSSGLCLISFSGSGEFLISQGMMYSYLAKKSSIWQTRSFTSGRCGMGSTLTMLVSRCLTLVWQASR